MSVTKQVWIEKDPPYEDVRQRNHEDAWMHASQFKFRIPLRRRGKRPGQYWDPLWPICVTEAAKRLNLDSVQIDASLSFRTADERDRAKELTNQLQRGYTPSAPSLSA
jgi:hypothetical protein